MAWRGRLVSFWALALIIVGLGVIRLVVAYLMPQEPSPLAPDEGTYAALAGVVGSGGDWAGWSAGWGSTLYPGSRALVGPAALAAWMGLEDLTAVRLVSVAYAVGAQLLLLSVAWLAQRTQPAERPRGVPLLSWPMAGLSLFVLLPSSVLWSNLGLRESACIFWALAAVTATAYLFSAQRWQCKLALVALLATSVSLAFQSRIYIAVALVIALASVIVWFGRERPRFSAGLALGLVAGTLAGLTLSLPASGSITSEGTQAMAQAEQFQKEAEIQARAATEAVSEAARLAIEARGAEIALEALARSGNDVGSARRGLTASSSAESIAALSLLEEASGARNPTNQVMQRRVLAAAGAARALALADARVQASEDLMQESQELRDSAPPDPGAPLDALEEGARSAPSTFNPDTYIERGSSQRGALAQYADSAIATDSCYGVPDPRSFRWCELSRIPGAAFAVMFRPLWPLDSPEEWSVVAVIATVENVIWLLTVASVAWLLATRRFPMTRVLALSLTYGVLLVGGMALLEGNLGTAFRHKSNVLWVLCLVMVLVGSSRRAGRVEADSTKSPDARPALGPEIDTPENVRVETT